MGSGMGIRGEQEKQRDGKLGLVYKIKEEKEEETSIIESTSEKCFLRASTE